MPLVYVRQSDSVSMVHSVWVELWVLATPQRCRGRNTGLGSYCLLSTNLEMAIGSRDPWVASRPGLNEMSEVGNPWCWSSSRGDPTEMIYKMKISSWLAVAATVGRGSIHQMQAV